MPTTRTWKPTNSGYILDAVNCTDGAPFALGDTLVVNGGGPNAQSLSGNVAPLATGSYQINPTGASTGLKLVNMRLDAASTLGVVGPQVLPWQSTGQFVTDGAIQVGSAAAPGSLIFQMSDLSTGGPPATITNTGSITLQNGSRFQTDIVLDNNDVFLNAAGAVLSVNGGSVFDNPDPAAPLGVASAYNSAKITNNGLIAVNGAAGKTTKFYFQGSYSGAGLLSVRGVPGAARTDTFA